MDILALAAALLFTSFARAQAFAKAEKKRNQRKRRQPNM